MIEHEPDGGERDGKVGNLGANEPADGLNLALQDEPLQVVLQIFKVLLSGRLVTH